MHTAAEFGKTELNAQDPRVKHLNKVLRQSGATPDSLIQVLHHVQGSYGYLPKEILAHVSREMRLPPSRVYGVVTFYHFFSLKPKGQHNCLVCTGTACYVKGANAILEEIQRRFRVKPGEVTSNKKLGIQTARCLGACGLAPAVVLDDEIIARVQGKQICDLIEAKVGAQHERGGTGSN